MTARAGDSGQASVLVVGLALVAIAISGVVVDGTRAFIARRTLQNAADAAALAGAGELDEAAVLASGGRVVVIDPARARRVAAQWLARRGVAARARVVADPSGVSIELRARVGTTFLGIVGITEIPVGARASAEPVSGRAQ